MYRLARALEFIGKLSMFSLRVFIDLLQLDVHGYSRSTSVVPSESLKKGVHLSLYMHLLVIRKKAREFGTTVGYGYFSIGI